MSADIALLVTLDRRPDAPLHRQLYDGVRAAVLAGRLPRGVRLPATRALAAQLAVSRNTVAVAFEQLVAEGYLEARVGDGTYVSTALPEDLLRAPLALVPKAASPRAGALSARGTILATTPVGVQRRTAARAFRVGLADFRLFPFEHWARIVARLWREPQDDLLG